MPLLRRPVFKLLTRNPEHRLGCRGGDGLKDVQRHPWFQGLEWDLVESKEMRPAFTPDVSQILLRFIHRFFLVFSTHRSPSYRLTHM